MKKKYFFRGLGTGIVFGAIVMLAAYMTSGGYKMSDEEVMKRAQKLGMETTSAITTEPTTEITTESISEMVSNKVETDATAETTDETTEATTEAPATTEEETEATTEEVTEATTEATTEKQPDDKKGTKATITVSGGMSSETISALLEDAGLVDSATDFNSFLVKNGYDSKLEVGSFSLHDNMTYDEIAKILTKQ